MALGLIRSNSRTSLVLFHGGSCEYSITHRNEDGRSGVSFYVSAEGQITLNNGTRKKCELILTCRTAELFYKCFAFKRMGVVRLLCNKWSKIEMK